MTKRDESSAQWAQAWIDEQREKLRQAAEANTAADSSTNAGTDPLSALRRKWLEMGRAFLTGANETEGVAGEAGAFAPNSFQAMPPLNFSFDRLLVPPLGLLRVAEQEWRDLVAAYDEYGRIGRELQKALIGVQMRALQLLEHELNAKPSPAGTPGSFRQMYDAWVECGEKAYAQAAHSEKYANLQASFGNASIAVRACEQKIIERALKYFDLPTRSELNTVHRQLREIRARLEQLESERARAQPGKQRTPRSTKKKSTPLVRKVRKSAAKAPQRRSR